MRRRSRRRRRPRPPRRKPEPVPAAPLVTLARVDVRVADLVDPTREEVLAALPVQVDPEVVEFLITPPGGARAPRPVVEAHGAYVFGVLMAAHPLPEENRIVYQEVDFVATPTLLVTVRKTPTDRGVPAYLPPPPLEGVTSGGALVHNLVDDVAESYLSSIDEIYGEIEELEDAIDSASPSMVRDRISSFRHELLDARRMMSATRAGVRRIVDGRIEVGDHALFPPEIELRFADTYETLVRVIEELDIARELLAGVRDHHQSKIAEGQGDIAKKLTVVASLVLVPSLIVGFYGQNFGPAFDEGYWQLSVSMGLIVGSTIAQLVLYRWRRWI
jgi:Mg2+ and Co2+ transporter CorA